MEFATRELTEEERANLLSHGTKCNGKVLVDTSISNELFLDYYIENCNIIGLLILKACPRGTKQCDIGFGSVVNCALKNTNIFGVCHVSGTRK